MKIMGTGMELTIIKWTFGLVFGGIVILFAGKIIAVTLIAAKLKLIIPFQTWLHGGTAASDIGGLAWEALKKAVTGGK